MHPVTPHRQHIPALDGLRGLAILMVVVYHNFDFTHYFFFGWMGVDLFFVLSGFLITDILLKSVNQPHFLRNFYIRRVLRIFPLYYLTLGLFLLLLPRYFSQLQVSYYLDNQVWLWTYLQNWLYSFKNPDQYNLLNHFWSLAVEEQFYMVWPLLILLLKKPRYLLMVIGAVLLCVIGFRIWIWNNQVPDLAYFNLYTFTRIDGICIGSMIALLQRIKPKFLENYMSLVVLLFAGFNFLFYFINSSNQYSFPYLAIAGYTTFAMVFGLLVNEAAAGDNKLMNAVFTISPLRFLGKISYGLYIFHWPVYVLLTPYLYRLFSGTLQGQPLSLAMALTATILSVAISWLSFQYFERYFLRLKDRFI